MECEKAEKKLKEIYRKETEFKELSVNLRLAHSNYNLIPHLHTFFLES